MKTNKERNCSSTEGKRKVTVTVNCVTVKRKFQKIKERSQLRSAKFRRLVSIFGV